MTKVRKRWGLIARDFGAFLTGRTELRSNLDTADPWLHPVDADYALGAPELHFGPFDHRGLPMQVFGVGKPVYVPSRMAAFGLAHWSVWRRTACSENLEAFLKAARWFGTFEDGGIRHEFDLAGMEAPWVSALAQGLALSMFARAELVEPGKWLHRAQAILAWMERDVSAGGAADRLPDKSRFLEEYPNSAHRHVLNGCLYALVGIGDLLRHGPDDRAQSLHDEIVGSVATNIGAWERSGWSLYEYHSGAEAHPPNFNTMRYQRVHIILLTAVGRAARNVTLLAAAARLEAAACRLNTRLFAMSRKIAYRAIKGW